MTFTLTPGFVVILMCCQSIWCRNVYLKRFQLPKTAAIKARRLLLILRYYEISALRVFSYIERGISINQTFIYRNLTSKTTANTFTDYKVIKDRIGIK